MNQTEAERRNEALDASQEGLKELAEEATLVTTELDGMNLAWEKLPTVAVPAIKTVEDQMFALVGTTEDFATASADSFEALANFAGEGTRASKAFATASATINTSLAIIKVWSDAPTGTPFFVKLSQSLLLASQLQKQADIINATPVPTVQAFADGGLVYGNSHANGGEKFAVGG
ncbi:unnamed protein product, partial [marine sediment metagenome]